jgi:hypothetical protein
MSGLFSAGIPYNPPSQVNLYQIPSESHYIVGQLVPSVKNPSMPNSEMVEISASTLPEVPDGKDYRES